MPNKNYTFIDLFSGCGGFSHGLEKAGHECLLGVDFNQDAIESFKLNHPNSNVYCGDIKELSYKEIQLLTKKKKIDMVVGGPPCQGFSTIGRGQVNDERNSLFKEFVRIVKEAKPRIVLMENVTGLLAKKNQEVLKSIFKSFNLLGYSMDARVLSAEEFGVPERRRRTFLVGVKNGSYEYPYATHGPKANKIDLAQIKNDLDRKRLKHIPEGKGIRYERDELAHLPKKLRYDVDWVNLSENRFRQTKLQRLDRKKPSPTILTSRTTYFHPIENRYLTPREAALLQSFPIRFKFFGSQTSIFRQIGNAVPPKLAQVLGESLKNIKWKKKKLETLSNFEEKRQSLVQAFKYS